MPGMLALLWALTATAAQTTPSPVEEAAVEAGLPPDQVALRGRRLELGPAEAGDLWRAIAEIEDATQSAFVSTELLRVEVGGEVEIRAKIRLARRAAPLHGADRTLFLLREVSLGVPSPSEIRLDVERLRIGRRRLDLEALVDSEDEVDRLVRGLDHMSCSRAVRRIRTHPAGDRVRVTLRVPLERLWWRGTPRTTIDYGA